MAKGHHRWRKLRLGMATVIVVTRRLRVGDTVVDAGARGNHCHWGLIVVVIVIVVIIVRAYQREEDKDT